MILVSKEKKTMLQDLTFLNHSIAHISASLDMDIDTSLYKNKIIEDVFFITNTLSKIEEKIAANDIEEKEYILLLKKIKNVKDSAIILMENIIKYKYKQSIIFNSHTNDIKSFISLYKNNSDDIQKRLTRKLFSSHDENHVSKAELFSLFSPEVAK